MDSNLLFSGSSETAIDSPTKKTKVSFVIYFIYALAAIYFVVAGSLSLTSDFDSITYNFPFVYLVFFIIGIFATVILMLIFLKIKDGFSAPMASLILVIFSVLLVICYFGERALSGFIEDKKWQSFDISYKTSSVADVNNGDLAYINTHIIGKTKRFCRYGVGFDNSPGCWYIDKFFGYKVSIKVSKPDGSPVFEKDFIDVNNPDMLQYGDAGPNTTDVNYDSNSGGADSAKKYYENFLIVRWLDDKTLSVSPNGAFSDFALTKTPLEKPMQVNLSGR